jgi:penicillin-insensitive murein DD-endopeptidase
MPRGLLAALAVVGLAAAAAAAPTAALRGTASLPARYKAPPLSRASLTVGHPNDGFQVRAKRLQKTDSLAVRKASNARVYGHPALVLMLRRSARDVALAAPGSVLLVGDLSAKAGGAISGHRSHQSGRDADVAFYVKDARGKPLASRDFTAFDGDGKAKDGSSVVFDDMRNWLLVESWAKDRRAGLSHVFVSAPLRARLLGHARKHPRFARYLTEATALLKQPEHGEPHDDHFHVRIECPKEQLDICRNESRTEGARQAAVRDEKTADDAPVAATAPPGP